MFGMSLSCPGLTYHDHFKGRKKAQAKRKLCVLRDGMFSSRNIITGDGNHIALKRKEISILFHGPNE